MLSSPREQTFLVTGASGYLGAWIVKQLLEQGYRVRGTVRSEEKGAYLVAHAFERYKDRFNYAVVSNVCDSRQKDALSRAASEVDAIVHPATAFHYDIEDPEVAISTAVQGNLSVLNAASANPQVKRVVITSSVAAIMELGQSTSAPRVFAEDDWNAQSPKDVSDNGVDAWVVHKYFASKVHAEQAAWKRYRERAGPEHWDLVTILPSFICGPFIHEVKAPEQLNTSLADFFATLKGQKSLQELIGIDFSWLDVRDAAQAHVLALQKESAGGKRFVVSNGDFVWQDWLDLAHLLGHEKLPKGEPGAGKGHEFSIQFNADQARVTLGLAYQYSMTNTLEDTLGCFEEREWI